MERRLFIVQRLSALLLAPLVLVHLGLILYAVRGGLSAEEILSRTQGSLAWGTFYGVFVLAAAIHAPIGLRSILSEWTPWQGPALNLTMAALMLLFLGLGLRAVWAVVG